MHKLSPRLVLIISIVLVAGAIVFARLELLVKSPAVVPAAVPAAVAPETLATTSPSLPETKGEGAKKAPVETRAVSLDNASVSLLRALVNILCYAPPGSGLRSLSGSGVIIDERGIILTNAHVAQYFLLENRGVSCTIRSGNPAVDRYRAALLYISPFWIVSNPREITESNPIGTGQYDFALLAITGGANSFTEPSLRHFHVPLAAIAPSVGEPVAIASYGSSSLGTNKLKQDLYPALITSIVKDIFTFGFDTVDVLALNSGDSPVAQEGSSGGGVVDSLGRLIGTITTSGTDEVTGERALHAITAAYVRDAYKEETGQPLDVLLRTDLHTSIAAFAPRIGPLSSIITAHLP